MTQYMVNIDLPEVLDGEFVSLIPEQVEQVNKLMARNIISTYTLTMDRSKLWVVVRAKSEIEVNKVLQTFPLIRWMNFEIHELMFHHEASQFLIPRMSLN